MRAGVAGVNWTALDFVAAAVLLGGTGLMIELAVRLFRSTAERLGAAVALFVCLAQVWANLAVGIIGDEDNGLNWLFMGVIFVAFAGSVLAKFRPRGMAQAMKVAALAQFGAGIVGLYAGAPEALGFSAVLAGLWLFAGSLFSRAA
jgi:hypothetical protein